MYNDNAAYICWANSLTTKGLRHIQIRENTVREAVQRGDVEVLHIKGAINLADMFTKEDKDPNHFILIRDTIMDTPNIEIRESEQSVVDLMPTTSPQAQGGVIG